MYLHVTPYSLPSTGTIAHILVLYIFPPGNRHHCTCMHSSGYRYHCTCTYALYSLPGLQAPLYIHVLYIFPPGYRHHCIYMYMYCSYSLLETGTIVHTMFIPSQLQAPSLNCTLSPPRSTGTNVHVLVLVALYSLPATGTALWWLRPTHEEAISLCQSSVFLHAISLNTYNSQC